MSILFLNIKDVSRHLTKNFSTKEVIKASHPEENSDIVFLDQKVINVAQYIRDALNAPVGINSAFRSPEFNATLEGSVKNSQHLSGRALDLSSKDIVEFMEIAKETKNEHWVKMYDLGLRGLGLYSWGVHIDSRESINVAFWDYRKKKELKQLTKPLWAVGLLILFIWISKKRSSLAV